MSYDVWTAKDGRGVPVRQMSDLHLLHTIRAIDERSLFPPYIGSSGEEYGKVYPNKEGERWAIVLKAEAIRRGLDWSKAPIRKVGLVDFVFECMANEGWSGSKPTTWAEIAKTVLARHGIVQPQIDVSNLDGSVTYLHWKTGEGVGTPTKE